MTKFGRWLKRSEYSASDIATILNVTRQAVYHWSTAATAPCHRHLVMLIKLSHNELDATSFGKGKDEKNHSIT